MRRPTYIPEPVRQSLRQHIGRAVANAVDAHESGQEDEDTLTGQLGYALRTRRTKRVKVDGRVWTWEINYHKLRGRGPNAAERIVGADGVVEFTLDGIEERFTKSSLFQAKNGRRNHGLLDQASKLRTWSEAAFFIRYDPTKYTAFGLEDAVKQALRRPHSEELPLDEFLMDTFIECLIGDTELHYDPGRRELRWKDQNGQVVHAAFSIRHSLEIIVRAPKGPWFHPGTRIDLQEIPDHRMEATDEEILGVARDPTLAQVKRARRDAAKVFHADQYQHLEPGMLRIFDLWMQEKNAAADRVLIRLKKPDRDS